MSVERTLSSATKSAEGVRPLDVLTVISHGPKLHRSLGQRVKSDVCPTNHGQRLGR